MKHDLHRLIHTLDKSEKRLFKIFAKNRVGRKQGNYIHLFDTMAGMEVYDTAILLKALENTSYANHLSPTCSRLFNLIVDSLSAQHNKKTGVGNLRYQISTIEILLDKGIYATGRKRIRQAKEFARSCEQFSQLHRLIELETQCFIAAPQKNQAQFFSRIEEEQKSCLEQLTQYSTLHLLHENFRMLTWNVMQQREGIDTVQRIMKHPALHTPPEPKALLAYSLFQNIHGMFFLRKGAWEDAFAIYQPLIDKWEGNPELLNLYASFYLRIVNNFMISISRSDQFKSAFLLYAQQIRNVNIESKVERLRMERIINNHELTFHSSYGSFNSALQFIQYLKHWLKQHENQLQAHRVLMFEFNLSVFYFVFGDYANANLHIQQILNFPGQKSRQDIRDFSRLFHAVIQYELGNSDLSEYAIKAEYNRLLRNKSAHVYELSLIRGIRSLIQNGLPSEKSHADLLHLKAQLDIILQNEADNPMGIWPMILWVESKIKGIPMRDHFEAVTRAQRKKKE